MAVFRQYNIQLLPLDTKSTKEVGVEGYKKLFELFKADTTIAYQNKLMADKAHSLVNDTFICPFVIHIEEKFTYGSFLKFHKAETVTEFYSQERLFEAQVGTTAVSNCYYFRFVFDYEYHRFGIEENGGKLPSPDVMQKTLFHFLEKIAITNFPNHVLTINLVADTESLDNVFTEGNEYGSIDVKIAFPNSHRLNATLRELKDCSAHSISAHVAPARGSRMSGMPSYVRDLVHNAPELGEAKITFFKRVSVGVGNFKKFFYSTSNHPKYLNLRQKKNEDDAGFIKRVWMNLKAKVEIDQS